LNIAVIYRSIRVLAKIETLESLQKLEEIVEASDGIMVARGDLGIEVPLEQIPTVQEDVTRLCRQLNKPVIIASQLLESMVECPTPTRAEVLYDNICCNCKLISYSSIGGHCFSGGREKHLNFFFSRCFLENRKPKHSNLTQPVQKLCTRGQKENFYMDLKNQIKKWK